MYPGQDIEPKEPDTAKFSLQFLPGFGFLNEPARENFDAEHCRLEVLSVGRKYQVMLSTHSWDLFCVHVARLVRLCIVVRVRLENTKEQSGN